ncbi:Receptor-like protein [Drosera capensis]
MKKIVPILLFIIFIIINPPALSLNSDGLVLHRVRLGLSDPDSSLSNWDPTNPTPCNWTGVTCSSRASVVSLDFSNFNLGGPFPTLLCSLSNLTFLSFYNNNINGSLPDEIGSCKTLIHLDLAMNLIVGSIPGSLVELGEILYLDLSQNNFSGEVPAKLGEFRKLEVLSLMGNLLNGEFPSFLGDVTTLKQFNVSYNPFRPSQLGAELGNLVELEVIWATQCGLVGRIPDQMGRLRNLKWLDLSKNQLVGRIPDWITELTRLEGIELYTNSFTGELPATGWGNLTELRYIDVSMNDLNGTIPDELTRLPLNSLSLYQNRFTGEFPESVADSPNLTELKVFSNRLTGPLPVNLGKKSTLVLIDVSDNFFSGPFPASLCAGGQLEQLLMIHNLFSGEIPGSLGQCRSLNRVRLSHNSLSGEVPAGFWGLPHVSLLELSYNSLTGEISKEIASAGNLSMLEISNNGFTGQIPVEIGFLSNLVSFLGNDNKFSGSIPDSIGNLGQLVQLDLSGNELSGEIPGGISSLKKLNDLSLADNVLSGPIPAGIGNLSALNYLDLSNNQLSGEVPVELENLKLNQLNLSDNRLTGPLPPLFTKEIYTNSFLGNPGLCGDITGLCDATRTRARDGGYIWMIFALAGVVLIVGIGWFYLRYKNFKKTKKAMDRSKWTLMSFHKLGFSELDILDCLDEDNVIGTGASGKVYKAVLSNGEIVAVKKLWGPGNSKFAASEDTGLGNVEKGAEAVLDHDDGFEAEVETLGKIRHKSIVRLWCCCSTKDCKLLVYEYMPNGSLGDLLHSNKSGLLDWRTRYKISLDAAEGLSYLHHDCVPPIVHRDVKSNNILLDGDFGAKVADFGVAKVVDVSGKGTKSMSVIAGSCGYIAPEYAYTLRVNEKSDIYSFGVVILELVTGKRPVDPEYGEKDLVKWVCTTIDQKGVDHILDPKLDACFNEEISKVLDIGLLCTSPLPINRPSMRRVVKMLLEVSGENLSKGGSKDGKLTPYYNEDPSENGSVA